MLDTGLSRDLTVSNSSEGKITLTRHTTGERPIFHGRDGQRLILSSNYKKLLDHMDGHKRPRCADRHYIAEYLAFQAPHTDRTLCPSIKLLRAGEERTFSHHETKYRSRFTTPQQSNSEIQAQDLRVALTNQLNEMSPASTVFQISSGLDSSILAILAAKTFGDRPVRLASCVCRGRGVADEIANVRRLAQSLGAQLDVFDFTQVDVFAAGRELMQSCVGYPIAYPSHLVEFLLDREIKRDADVIVTGKGPDDVLAGYPWHADKYGHRQIHQQRLTVTPLPVLEALLKTYPTGLFEYWQGEPTSISLVERLLYDSRSLTESSNIVHEALSTYLGVQIASPFMHASIRGPLLALGKRHKIDGSQHKMFLRRSFSDDYPDYILSFAKTGLRIDLRPYFMDYSAETLLNNVLVDRQLASEHFHINEVERMVASTLFGDRNFGWQLWSIFCLMSALTR